MDVKIDLSHFAAYRKNLTVSLAAWLLAYFPDESLWDHDQMQSMVVGVASACQQIRSASAATIPPLPPKKDANTQERIASFPTSDSIVKVFTDYQVAKDIVNMPGSVVFVGDEQEADFLLTLAHIKNFTTMPFHRRACQFPFEAGLIRKVIPKKLSAISSVNCLLF